MSSFVARNAELDFLQEKYESPDGQLVIIYGRRRIGKTETISHFCKGKRPLFFTCTQTDDKSQLRNFSSKLLAFNPPQAKYITEFATWEQAFSAIKDIPRGDGHKQIAVIDEFPYMAKESKEVPSVLQKVWDAELKNQNILLILCGSAMSYIEKDILSEKNPLYGRATGIYKMMPMSFFDSTMFFPNWSNKDKVIAYSILGGVPYYLSQFNPRKTLKENICSNILKKGSVLYSEPEFLMRQELREPATYNTIIQAIASGRTSFNEIQQATLIEKGKLSVYLKNLIELGLLSREFPLLATEKERQNTQRGIYKLHDLFFRFWYRFVFPNYSSLEFGDWEDIYKFEVEPRINEFVSFPFEDICKEWLRTKNRKRELPFVFTKVGNWWDKNTEIDIVAVDADKSHVLSAECKFHNAAVNSSDLARHIGKNISALGLKDESEILFWYFSWGGYTKEAVRFAEENNIHLVNGKDLFDE